MHPRPAAVAIATPLCIVLLVPSMARASVFGEENAVLAEIAATLGTELSTVTDGLKKAKEYYGDFKEYAGYARQAYDTFEGARNFNLSTLTSGELLDDAFPDASRIRRDVQRGDFWSADPGMNRMARLCFSEILDNKSVGSRCHDFEGRADASEVRESLSQTFGPTLTPSGKAARDTAAEAIAVAHNYQSRAAASRELIKPDLDRTCATATDPSACQLAANAAQIHAISQLADINDQLAEANRLAAIRLEQENERRGREQQAAQLQEQLAVQSARQAFRAPIRVVTSDDK